MEYPELHDQESAKLAKDVAKRDRLTIQITESRRILKEHLALAERRGDDIALAETYADEGYLDDETVDTRSIIGPMQDDELRFNDVNEEMEDDFAGQHIATDIREGAGVDRILTLIQNKLDLIDSQSKDRDKLNSDIKQLRALLPKIRGFNPSVEQSKRHKYLDQFNTNVKKGKRTWLDAHRNRRRFQDRQINSLLKVVMDMFVRLEYRGLPRDINANFDDPKLIDPIPFDPARISDTLLEGLGFKLPKEDSNELEALQHKRGLVGALKDVLKRCTPMTLVPDGGKRNYRLLVVGPPDGKEIDRNTGKIIMPVTDTSTAPNERQRTPMVFDSAYSALRQAGHVERKFEVELGEVGTAKHNLDVLFDKMLNLKKTDDNYEKNKASLIRELTDFVENLKRFRNFYKKDYKECLGCIKDLKDKLGRENIGASRARMVRILNDVDSRIREASNQSLAYPENRTALLNMITPSSQTLYSYGKAFENYANGSPSDHSEFKALEKSLDKLTVRPFNVYAVRIKDCIRRMSSIKGEGFLEKRRKVATKAHAITILFRVHEEFAETIASFSFWPNTKDEIILKNIESLKSNVTKIIPSEYPQPFNDVISHLNTFEYNEGAPGTIAEQAKEHLKELNFEKLLSDIK